MKVNNAKYRKDRFIGGYVDPDTKKAFVAYKKKNKLDISKSLNKLLRDFLLGTN